MQSRTGYERKILCKNKILMTTTLASIVLRINTICHENNQDKFLIKKGHFSNTLQGYEKFLNTVLSKCLDKDKILFGMEVTGIYGTNLYERLKSDGYHVVMIFRIPLKITETTNDLIKQIKLILPVLPNFF